MTPEQRARKLATYHRNRETINARRNASPATKEKSRQRMATYRANNQGKVLAARYAEALAPWEASFSPTPQERATNALAARRADLLVIVGKSIPRYVPLSDREEYTAEIALAMLEGLLSAGQIAKAAQRIFWQAKRLASFHYSIDDLLTIRPGHQ